MGNLSLSLDVWTTYPDISYLMTSKPLKHVKYCGKPSSLVHWKVKHITDMKIPGHSMTNVST